MGGQKAQKICTICTQWADRIFVKKNGCINDYEQTVYVFLDAKAEAVLKHDADPTKEHEAKLLQLLSNGKPRNIFSPAPCGTTQSTLPKIMKIFCYGKKGNSQSKS